MMSADATNIPGLDTILRGEIMRKDALIQQLVSQNKELMAARERQDIELTAQRRPSRSTGLTSTSWTPPSPTPRPTSSGSRRSRGR